MPVTTKKDYYEILGVPKSASVDEIKKVYRELAMKHHPDRVPAEQKKAAEERFKEISEAYAALSDPEKRKVYDQFGHQGFDQRYSTEDIFRNADFSSVFGDLGGAGGGAAGSIFEELFGMFGAGAGGSRRSNRGADLEFEMRLSFEEAARGVERTITVPRREVCQDCKGEGGTRATCATCHGEGRVRQNSGFFVVQRACPKCQGEGSTITKPCPTCRGAGRIETQRKIQVKVPAGIEDGMRLRVTGEGEGGVRGRGDLYVLVHVDRHPVFQREGAHLIVEYPVTIAQAALGTELEVPSLNGRVSMKVPAGTQSGTIFRVRNKGLSDLHTGRTGDLLVRVAVETPANLNSRQRQLLEEFNKAAGDDAYPSRRSFLAKIKDALKK